nr:Hypothetical protein CBG02376 [Haemonchus contortus]
MQTARPSENSGYCVTHSRDDIIRLVLRSRLLLMNGVIFLRLPYIVYLKGFCNGMDYKLSLEDIAAIKEVLPKDAPLFLFLNNLTVHHENVVYKASDEFRAKTEMLRRKQENMAYKRIVQSVDASQKYGKIDHMENFGAELRAVNRQLINIINIVITVVGAFFFGFSGVQFAYPHLHLDIATRFIIGLIPATIVFFADLYFVIKTMDRDDTKDCPPGVLSFKEMAKKNE